MSMCSVCGAQEWHDVSHEGAMLDAYCPRCSPRPVTILPVDDGGQQNPVSVANAATGPAIDFGNDPNSGMYSSNGSAVQFDTNTTGPISLEMEGSKVMTAYDELPETAEEGELAFKKGENTAYVFDGEEWQNLGAALRRAKPSVVSPRDAKCDRRGAIAATKAKTEKK